MNTVPDPTRAVAPEAGARELRNALLVRPAVVTAAAGVVVVVLAAALDGHRAAGAVSALVGVAVVLLASGITGVLGIRTATARAEAVFAIAMVSFLTKVLVFAVALAVVGSVPGAHRIPFGVAAIVSVLVWLAVEVFLVSRLRSTGAAVFGPPARTGGEPSADPGEQLSPGLEPAAERDRDDAPEVRRT